MWGPASVDQFRPWWHMFSELGNFPPGRNGLASSAEDAARIAAWFAAVIYAANPNLIYLQTTAMTEPIYLAFFIWAVVYFNEFVLRMQGSAKALAMKPRHHHSLSAAFASRRMLDALRRMVSGGGNMPCEFRSGFAREDESYDQKRNRERNPGNARCRLIEA